MKYDYGSATALITGASRGIGAEIARLFAERGVPTLILVARSQDELDKLAEELYARFQTRVEVITADLSEADAPERIKNETDRRGLSVDLLVNNAGFGTHGVFGELDEQREADMIAVNVSALTQLTRLYLPGMTARGRGAIVNMASAAGFQPTPFMATYGATKAFVLSFSEALWVENRGRGVRVVCVCPGGTETHFGEHLERGLFEYLPQSDPKTIAVATLDALEKNASFVVVGAMNYLATLGPRVLPRSATAQLVGLLLRPLPKSTETTAAAALRRKLIAGAALGVALGAAAIVATRRRQSAS